MEELIIVTPQGLYCPQGDFYLDPSQPVAKAVVSHAHGDHATWGCEQYVTATRGKDLLQIRVGEQAQIGGLEFREPLLINGVKVTLFPAGHILGSSQILLEHSGRRLVFSGDYKTTFDASCVDTYEPVKCDIFITESTFGLPIYQWQPQQLTFDAINEWWAKNKAVGLNSVIMAYALGKSQRLLSGIDSSIGEIFVHGTIVRFDSAYRAQGVSLPQYTRVQETSRPDKTGGSLIIAPPSVQATSWLNKLSPFNLAFASGWMQVRGVRRRKGVDKGFVLSDHCDFAELNSAVEATGAKEVWVTHGYTESYSKFLAEKGLSTKIVKTHFETEDDEPAKSEGKGTSEARRLTAPVESTGAQDTRAQNIEGQNAEAAIVDAERGEIG